MKRILILLALLGTTVALTAQTWSPNGATWYFSFNQMLSSGYVKINYTSDTTVLNKDCKTLLKVQYGYSYPGVYDTIQLGKEYTYLDSVSNIVYRFFDGKFDTLYNFNAQIGDVWKVHGMHGTLDSGIVVVDSIGYEVINADTLKSLFVSTISGSCIGWHSAEIVERIECINEYIFPNYVSCTPDRIEGGRLRCYSDDNFPQYSADQSILCNFLTSIDSYNNIKDFIEVYPNPASASIIIRDKGTSPTALNIVLVSSLSQKVFESTFNIGKEIKIDIRDLKAGLYFLRITDNRGYSTTEKIIKD